MTARIGGHFEREPAPHPRQIGWLTTAALALGGSNQGIFIVGILVGGLGPVPGHGTAAVLLLTLGLLLAWAASPGWTELVLLSPNRVGGIAAACSDAFRPYGLVVSALAGACYWWGWVATCGLGAVFAAAAIHAWLVPAIPLTAIAIAIVVLFAAVNLGGLRWVARLALPIGVVAALLAFFSALVPVVTGHVDWRQATAFHLETPFDGWFGTVTSLAAGLYLVGFCAPSFAAATCYVGETVDPARNVPRAMLASAVTAGFYFVVIPIVWLGVLGPAAFGGGAALELGPRYAPLFGASAKALIAGLLVFNAVGRTLAALAGASRTLAQLSDDGIFPRFLGTRSERDVPWKATVLTAAAGIVFVSSGDPISLIAAANFTYVLAIGLPSLAVWLLRRDAPALERPYRAPRGTIGLGLAAAGVWALSAVLGFEQFGLRAVLLGVAMVYSGAALYAWRKLEDRPRSAPHVRAYSIHLLVTAAMVAVISLDGAGYRLAMRAIGEDGDAFTAAALLDIFVVVALIIIGAGLVLPEMIAVAATRKLTVANAKLQSGTEALRKEIAERKQAELQLFHVATHDELTGLPNRKLFLARFEHVLNRQRTPGEHYAAVLFLDLDRFKLVNDSLGHSAGDSLLVAVARCLERCIRPCDTLARMGGDEFIILLDDIDGECGASAFAEGVLAELASSCVVADHEVFAAASIGIAMTRIGDDVPEDVVRKADIAMYRAKQLGKQRYEIFRPELLTQAASRLHLQEDLKRALSRREFVLHYQPIVSLRTGDLRGFEALIRWQHPERGFVPPDEFIPAAEENGEILAIGAWVIGEACRQAALWRAAYPSRQPLAINVNVAPRQFSSSELLHQIDLSLTSYDLTPEHLHVEITESAIMGDPDIARATLLELRRLGIEVHLDDFGTGYSSLGHLHRFPVDTLKIDRSFISMSGPGVGNLAIVQTIASLAQSLSIETTAEGVETREQLEHLRSLGCTSAQGYYFSKPVSAGDAATIIENWRNPAELRETPLLQRNG